MNYTIKTWHTESGDIHQTISWDGFLQDKHEVIISHVIHTSDAVVRAMLIEMGWTPPPDQPQVALLDDVVLSSVAGQQFVAPRPPEPWLQK